MNVHAIHMVFSPQSCPLDLLDATLTNDRRVLAERLLQQIRSDISRKTASHTLIIGPRGSGKTHLLAFVQKPSRNQQRSRQNFSSYLSQKRSMG